MGVATAEATATSTKCRTLVVEDDHASCTALVKILQRKGHDVECAVTLAEAMDKLDAWRPECVLLDLMLPDGNGLEFLRKLKHEKLSVRVAVVTGAGDAQLLDAVLRLKPEGFFQKPVDVYQMLTWLQGAGPHGNHPSP